MKIWKASTGNRDGRRRRSPNRQPRTQLGLGPIPRQYAHLLVAIHVFPSPMLNSGEQHVKCLSFLNKASFPLVTLVLLVSLVLVSPLSVHAGVSQPPLVQQASGGCSFCDGKTSTASFSQQVTAGDLDRSGNCDLVCSRGSSTSLRRHRYPGFYVHPGRAEL